MRLAAWKVCVALLAVLGSCAGIAPSRPVDPLTLVPRQLSAADGGGEFPWYANRLVVSGHSFGLPQGWEFRAPPVSAGAVHGFSLSGDEGNVKGLVEFIDLETEHTGLTPELFLRNVREIAEHRSDSLVWDLFTVTYRFGDGQPPQTLRYYVLTDPGRITVVITGTTPENLIAPLDGRFDILAFQFLCETCDADAFVANHRLTGPHQDGRAAPETPTFYRHSNQWRWITDRPGGISLRHDYDAATFTVVSLFRGDHRLDGEFARFQAMDPVVPDEERWLLVGPAAVLYQFEMVFRPRSGAISGPQYGTLHTLGTFIHGDTQYSLVIQQGLAVPTHPGWERSMLDAPELTELLQLCIDLGPP